MLLCATDPQTPAGREMVMMKMLNHGHDVYDLDYHCHHVTIIIVIRI